MKKKVIVTGGTGIIGTIVREDLGDRYDFTFLSRRRIEEPGFVQLDVANDYESLKDLMGGADAVVHLAYVEEDEVVTDNVRMAKNIYHAASSVTTPPRLVMASSIHAVAGHIDWSKPPFLHVANRDYDRLDKPPEKITTGYRFMPNGIYGALKSYIEVLGEFYAGKGLEVVCIRFGGVRTDDSFPVEPGYHAFWLSRRDCAQIVQKAVDAELESNFNVVFGVSGNTWNVYRLEEARNILGYDPLDNSEKR